MAALSTFDVQVQVEEIALGFTPEERNEFEAYFCDQDEVDPSGGYVEDESDWLDAFEPLDIADYPGGYPDHSDDYLW